MSKQVRVRWTDAVGGMGAGWQSAAALKKGLRRAMAHTTVGHVALEDKLQITVCASKQDITRTFHGCIAIPKHAIRKLERLR